MKNSEISGHADLLLRIEELKLEKFYWEETFKRSLNELVLSFSPVSMVKDSIHKLVTDKQVRTDLMTVGLNAGSDFIIDKVLGRNRSIKGFLSSLLVEKISSNYINKNSSTIIAGIKRLINRNGDQESPQQ